MKATIYSFSTATIIAIAMGCGAPKETAQSPAPEKVKATSVQEVALREGAAEDATVADQRERDLTEGIEKMTGDEIVAEAANRLKIRLSTKDEATNSISEILKETYLETGNELSNSYEIGEARNIGKEIIKSSANRIADLLDQDQLTIFKALLGN